MNKSKKKAISEEDDLFQFEKSSSDAEIEKIEELNSKDEEEEIPYEPRKTIKILAERDIQLKESPPPNYSPYFTCVLHFKNKNYKERKLLEIGFPSE